MKDGIDVTSVEGASTLPYAIPNITVELHTTTVGVPSVPGPWPLWFPPGLPILADQMGLPSAREIHRTYPASSPSPIV